MAPTRPPGLPTCIVIGAMKCGTSALHRQLDRHPEIAMACGKELNFFFGSETAPHDRAEDWWRTGQWHRGRRWYAAQHDGGASVRGESSPGYTDPSHPEVPARMRRVVPDVRLLYLVRDPVQRAVSQWRHHARDGTEQRSVEDAVLDPASQYLARSRYAERVAPFLEHFPEEQLLVVVQERLLADPRPELCRVFDHVGADPTYWDDALTERVHVGDGPGQPVRQPLADAVWDAVDDDIARLRQLLGDPLPEWPRPSAAPGMAPGRLGTEQGTPTKEERLMPGKKELPSTLERSAKKAQRTWIEAHDSAVEEYGEGERAHRTAFSALKHSYEKVGDHWEAKDEKGPSDKQAAKSGGAARKGGRTAGGVDANASKSHLMEVAKKLDVTGRSRMTKDELVDAIKKANARQTRKSRS